MAITVKQRDPFWSLMQWDVERRKRKKKKLPCVSIQGMFMKVSSYLEDVPLENMRHSGGTTALVQNFIVQCTGQWPRHLGLRGKMQLPYIA